MALNRALPGGSVESTDALAFLINDHLRVNDLFQRFERLPERSAAERQRLLDQIGDQLTVHAQIEEQVFYPAVRELLAEGDPLVEESLGEHREVKDLLSQLMVMDPDDSQFGPRMITLINEVRHHVHEEEGEMFPKLRQAVGETPLAELGRRLEEASADAKATLGGRRREPDPPLLAGPELVESLFEPVTAARTQSRPAPRARTTASKKATAKAIAKKAPAKKTTAKKRAPAKKATATSQRAVYHVVPNDRGGWSVKKKNASRASSSHDRKTDAVQRGRALAKRGRLGQLVVHNADGTIQGESTYGKDPRRTRG